MSGDLGKALFTGADEGIFELAEVIAERIREVGGDVHEGYKSAKAVKLEKGHSRVILEEWVPEKESKLKMYKCPERKFVIAVVSEPRKGEHKVEEQVDFLIGSGAAKEIIVKNCNRTIDKVVGVVND